MYNEQNGYEERYEYENEVTECPNCGTKLSIKDKQCPSCLMTSSTGETGSFHFVLH